jgi:hypothetical protein
MDTQALYHRGAFQVIFYATKEIKRTNDNICLQEASLTTPNQSHHQISIIPYKFSQSQNKKEIEQLQIRKMESAVANHYTRYSSQEFRN